MCYKRRFDAQIIFEEAFFVEESKAFNVEWTEIIYYGYCLNVKVYCLIVSYTVSKILSLK